MKTYNIANYLIEAAEKFPLKEAIIEGLKDSKYKKITFSELNILSNQYANYFIKKGVKDNQKVLILINFSINFIAITYALFKIGAIPVFIDKGTRIKKILKSMKNVEPYVLIGNLQTNIIGIILKRYITSIKLNIIIFENLPILEQYFIKKIKNESAHFKLKEGNDKKTIAILFTSGSTGQPKAVIYTHEMIKAQLTLLKEQYEFISEETDLSTLPVFSLFDAALQMTTIIPNVNIAKPSSINPKNIIQCINQFKATTTYASPLIIEKILKYISDKQLTLPSLRRLLIYGSPLPTLTIQKIYKTFQNVNISVTYGATEALPISSITLDEIKKETLENTMQGKGICLGYTFKNIKINIIKISEHPIENINDTIILDKHLCGEIIVYGDIVSTKYYNDELSTKLSKIKDKDKYWHRTGDIGFTDEKNRLWYMGRKEDIIYCPNKMLFTIPIETLYDNYYKINKSALIGLGNKPNQIPVIIIQPYKKYYPKNKNAYNEFVNEVILMKKSYHILNEIKHVLFHPSLPLDIRHNSKILRKELISFAKERLT